MSVKANDIATVIISLANPEVGDSVSNLKLQKLLYYCQGFHLAFHDKEPLFDEKVIAWQYGPVVTEVYHEYKENGSQGIILAEDIDASTLLSKKQFRLIKEVYKVYGQYSALRLMEMTHRESPWKKTGIGHEITHDLMYSYFRTIIDK